MKKSITIDILGALSETLKALGHALPLPFETPYGYVKRQRNVGKKTYYDTVYRLQKRGAVKIINKNGQKFIKLTKKGELETLLAKTRLAKPGHWDGKFRLFMFDIPEYSHTKRDQLRYLLKREGYKKLQASVFINPYPLNREGIEYLQKTGLINYIRIMRVDDMDNDKELKKYFDLSQ